MKKIFKILISSLVFFLIVSWSGIAYAGDEDICFSQETAQQIVVGLEKEKSLEKQNQLYEEANAELSKQIEQLRTIVDLQKEQIELQGKALEQYKSLITLQKEAYEKQLEQAKPSLLEEIKVRGTYTGIGALLVFLLLAL